LKNKTVKLKEHYIGVLSNNIDKRGSATYYLNITALTGLPALMTFGLGPNADELETMPEKLLK
jgi:monoamine oxidase